MGHYGIWVVLNPVHLVFMAHYGIASFPNFTLGIKDSFIDTNAASSHGKNKKGRQT
jgi:hypothetical protein